MKFEDLFECVDSICEGLTDVKKKYVLSGKIPEETFNELAAADPSRTNKYIEWMCREWLANESLRGHLIDVVKMFDRLASQRKIENTDIYSYTVSEADAVVEEALSKKSKREQKKETIEQGSEVVYEDDKITIYKIDTHKASRTLGAGADWCVSREHDNYWNQYYLQKGCAFYYTVTKSKPVKKFAINVFPDGKKEVWDEKDKKITYESYLKQIGSSTKSSKGRRKKEEND